jgi:hypothetical protein
MLDLEASGTVTLPTTGSLPAGPASTWPCHRPATNVWPKLREAGARGRAEQDDPHAATHAGDTAANRAESAIRRDVKDRRGDLA